MEYLKRTWIEVDLDNAEYNWRQIKEMADGRYIMPVVKADAYGHGANILADMYEKNGAEGFAVSNINEAIKLRKFGITKNILVLGFTPTEFINQLYAFNISQAVYCEEYAKELSEAAEKNCLIIKAHLKLDTGMCRIGFDARGNDLRSLVSETERVLTLPALHFEGVFTHFSSADSLDADDIAFSDRQYELFSSAVNALKEKGFAFKYIHCCNSAASALRGKNEGNLIRPGIILYGLPPAAGLDIGVGLKPVLSVKSCVSMVKVLDAGCEVSYGRTYKTDSAIKVATVPIGYADGYPRSLSGKGKMIINGKYAPVIGRVCMDQLMVDVSGIDGVTIGTPVTVVGSDGDCRITLDDIAEACGTISYEIMCDLSIRMPRVYIKNGKTTDILYLGGTL